MGEVLVNDKKAIHIPKFPVDIVDTQGAGDAFLDMLAAKLSHGISIIEAADYLILLQRLV